MRFLAATALFVASTAWGAEGLLAFTVSGPTLQSGQRQVLLSETPRFGRPEPYFRLENNLGFAYGVLPTLEAQLLLAISFTDSSVDGRGAEGALATRWRWQPLDGQTDLLGVGLLGTVAASTDSLFLEARVAFDKQVGNFLFALNASVDFVARRVAFTGPNTHLEQSGGIVYRLANGVTSGFEVRSRIGFERGKYYGAAIFTGPVLGFHRPSWWFSLAALPQVAAVKAPALYGNGQALEIRDNERWVMRLQLGIEVP